MITTANIPDDLELHEGDEFLLRAVAKNGALMITRFTRTASESERAHVSTPSNFTRKWAKTMAIVTDPDDIILSHINAKHVK
jgi:hypothetical protein